MKPRVSICVVKKLIKVLDSAKIQQRCDWSENQLGNHFLVKARAHFTINHEFLRKAHWFL